LGLTVIPPPEFSWNGGGSHSVLAGQTTAAYNFTAAPSGSSTFENPVTFACSNLPDQTVGCIFNPTQIPAGSGATSVSFYLTTKGPNTGAGTSVHPRANPLTPWWLAAVTLAGIAFAGMSRGKQSRVAASWFVLIVLAGLLVACGGVADNGSPPPPPPPPVVITVKPATTVSLYADAAGNAWPPSLTQQQFTAALSNSTNQNVTWAVVGGDSNGTIDSSGLYTSPAVAPNPAGVTITATAQADPSKSASGRISLLTPTTLGTFPSISISATEGAITHSQAVSLTVQ